MVSTIDGIPLTSGSYSPENKAPVGLFGRDGASFKDVLDTVNPLQQLPIIGSIYRSETGDTISPAAKVAGAALIGGPIGMAIAALDSVVEMASGATIGEHVVADVSEPPPPIATISQEQATREAAEALALSNPPEQQPQAEAPVSLTAQLAGRNALVYGRQQEAYANQQAMEHAYNKVLKTI